MMDPNIINHTDVNDDIDTDLSESTAPMMNSQMNHERPCFNSSARPMLDPEIVNQTNINSETVRWDIGHPVKLMTSCYHQSMLI